jgi:thiosulfate dehydrogenase (quinone) large subunit
VVVNLKERTYLWYIVILRLYIGYYLLQQGILKYLRGFPQSDWITRQIGDLNKIEIYTWYKSFLINVVAPNRELFGYLVMSGEILIGICLVLGLFTRLSAILGIFLLLNYYFGPGMARGGAPLAQQQTFIVVLVVLALSNPGRTLGLDALLFKKR